MRLRAQNCFLSRVEASLIRKLAANVIGRRHSTATAVIAANTIMNKMTILLDGAQVVRRGTQ